MSLHVEEVFLPTARIEFVSSTNDKRWLELEEQGVIRPEGLSTVLLWYDEMVMLTAPSSTLLFTRLTEAARVVYLEGIEEPPA